MRLCLFSCVQPLRKQRDMLLVLPSDIRPQSYSAIRTRVFWTKRIITQKPSKFISFQLYRSRSFFLNAVTKILKMLSSR